MNTNAFIDEKLIDDYLSEGYDRLRDDRATENYNQMPSNSFIEMKGGRKNMVWYNLQVGTFNIKYTPLKPREVEFPYCDENGNALKRVVEGKGKVYFLNEETNEKRDFAFKWINEKVVSKLQKTKQVNKYKEVEKQEVSDLIVEKEYIAECDNLLNELEETDKALKFGFTFGNGFKVYKAYIHTNPLYKGFLFMSVGTTQKSEIIQDIVEQTSQRKKIQQTEMCIKGIERAKVEDLIEI